jgi:NAD(P)-dependent dehydrogenase (short-subunit alcohol dehydrogenase family)
MMNNRDYYQDKICIVTGANSGIGYALSEELLIRGAIAYMAGRDQKKIAAAAGQLSVSYEPNHLIYGGYILGDKNVEEFLLKHTHDHRIRFEKEGRFL